MADFRFVPNPTASRELARSTQMAQFLKGVAEEGAKEVERRAPSIVKHKGSKISAESAQTMEGAEGQVVIRSPFWHWPEYGTSRYAPRPYLRPGVQAILSKYAGRWRGQ